MKDLQKIANDFFAANPDVEKVYVTSDGFVFLNKNAADLHASTNAGNKKLSVKVFEVDTSSSSVTGSADKEPDKEPVKGGKTKTQPKKEDK